MKISYRLTPAMLCLFLVASGCSWSPEGITPIKNFNIERYLGSWYEIARLDHSFERGLENVTAEYQKRDDGGIKVINRGFNKRNGQWIQATGKAYFTGDRQTGQLKVTFFGPFYSGYNIIHLDKVHYQYALVCGPNRSFLWILSRTARLAPAVQKQLLTKAQRLGFDTEKLIFVRHDEHGDARRPTK